MKTMQRFLIGVVLTSILVATFATPVAAQGDDGEDKVTIYKNLLQSIDDATRRIRFGEFPSLAHASAIYDELVDAGTDNEGNRTTSVENIPGLAELDNLIHANLDPGSSSTVENIRTIRGYIEQMASEMNVELPFVYKYSIFLVLGISVLMAFLVTLVNKHTVDWKKVKAAKDRMSAWQKELMDAQRKKDMKRVHKLNQERSAVMAEQKIIMSATFKPMVYYLVPYIAMWMFLNSIFAGWVIAWLPFNMPLIFTTISSMGFLSWYMLCYFGLSQLLRKIMIGV